MQCCVVYVVVVRMQEIRTITHFLSLWVEVPKVALVRKSRGELNLQLNPKTRPLYMYLRQLSLLSLPFFSTTRVYSINYLKVPRTFTLGTFHSRTFILGTFQIGTWNSSNWNLELFKLELGIFQSWNFHFGNFSNWNFSKLELSHLELFKLELLHLDLELFKVGTFALGTVQRSTASIY